MSFFDIFVSSAMCQYEIALVTSVIKKLQVMNLGYGKEVYYHGLYCSLYYLGAGIFWNLSSQQTLMVQKLNK